MKSLKQVINIKKREYFYQVTNVFNIKSFIKYTTESGLSTADCIIIVKNSAASAMDWC